MADKPRPTLADYIVTALSPALIMGLIGSLVFFLVEILYAGRYEGRLLWTLFFFVAGIVLVARISIEADAARAAFYGLGLALISWIALLAFIEYPKDSKMAPYAGLINFLLMALVWWCAHKLTWDCTAIDEKRQGSGRGLLAAAGFEHRPDTQGQVRDADLLDEESTAGSKDQRSLWERWRRYRERRRQRPHTPGLTVIWFSLAALPIFGLGQSLIPARDSARRAFTFWLAAAYVGCSLGLLLTTSFLGLRRYLRQRKVPMPKAMAGIWLGLGAALVLAFLLVAALLPRPYSETPIWNLDKLTSAQRKTAKNALLKDGPEKDTGEGKTKAGKDVGEGEGEGKTKAGNSGSADDNPDQDNRKTDRNKAPGDQREAKSKAGKNGEAGNAQDANGKASTGKEKGNGADEKKDEQGKQTPSTDRRLPDTQLGNALEKLLTFLKWLVFILLALFVLAFVFRGALQYLANFMPGARQLLAALSAWWYRLRQRRTEKPAPEEPVRTPPARRPFTSFSNPFADGTAEGRSVEELIAYSFTALEAWAADRNHPRRPDETPLEFSARLTNTFVSLEDAARNLAILVVRLAYANGTLPTDARQTLEQTWDRLATTMPAPALAE